MLLHLVMLNAVRNDACSPKTAGRQLDSPKEQDARGVGQGDQQGVNMAQRRKTVQRVLILGIGNIIMSDDGVGAKVVQELQRDYRFPTGVDIVDGGTLGLALLPLFEGRSHVIMVDAVETGRQPGFCVRLAGDELPSALETKLSPHQMGLKDLLGAAQLLGGPLPELVLIGVQPKSLAVGAELTTEVHLQVETMKGAVLKELDRIGTHVEPVTKSTSFRWDQ